VLADALALEARESAAYQSAGADAWRLDPHSDVPDASETMAMLARARTLIEHEAPLSDSHRELMRELLEQVEEAVVAPADAKAPRAPFHARFHHWLRRIATLRGRVAHDRRRLALWTRLLRRRIDGLRALRLRHAFLEWRLRARLRRRLAPRLEAVLANLSAVTAASEERVALRRAFLLFAWGVAASRRERRVAAEREALELREREARKQLALQQARREELTREICEAIDNPPPPPPPPPLDCEAARGIARVPLDVLHSRLERARRSLASAVDFALLLPEAVATRAPLRVVTLARRWVALVSAAAGGVAVSDAADDVGFFFEPAFHDGSALCALTTGLLRRTRQDPSAADRLVADAAATVDPLRRTAAALAAAASLLGTRPPLPRWLRAEELAPAGRETLLLSLVLSLLERCHSLRDAAAEAPPALAGAVAAIAALRARVEEAREEGAVRAWMADFEAAEAAARARVREAEADAAARVALSDRCEDAIRMALARLGRGALSPSHVLRSESAEARGPWGRVLARVLSCQGRAAPAVEASEMRRRAELWRGALAHVFAFYVSQDASRGGALKEVAEGEEAGEETGLAVCDDGVDAAFDARVALLAPAAGHISFASFRIIARISGAAPAEAAAAWQLAVATPAELPALIDEGLYRYRESPDAPPFPFNLPAALGGRAPPPRAMSFECLGAALALLVALTPPQEAGDSLPDRFEALLVNKVLPTCRWDDRVARVAFAASGRAAREVWARHADQCEELFAAFAVRKGSGVGPLLMDARGFEAAAVTLRLQGLKPQLASRVFEAAAGGGGGGGGGSGGYPCFQTAMALLAEWKLPDPLVPFALRLERFLALALAARRGK
jgi:hypothetical protein